VPQHFIPTDAAQCKRKTLGAQVFYANSLCLPGTKTWAIKNYALAISKRFSMRSSLSVS